MVVFLHGGGMDHRMFDAQVTALADDYQTLVWDMRAHGQSQPMDGDFVVEDCADDLIAILDDLGVEQAVLVGQSLGGYVVQYVYLRYPARVRAMCIIGSSDIAMAYPRWEIWALKAMVPLLRWWSYGHFTRLVARNAATKPDTQAYALAAIQQLDREDFLTVWQGVALAIDETGIPDHRIGVPLLLTHGDHDQAGSVQKYAAGWAAKEPDSKYVVIPDAGHNANQDNPAFFKCTAHGVSG